jgi:flagellar basal-body rod modification protein FlgD
MSTINPMNPSPSGGSSTAQALGANGLGKDDFLKLLVGQLQHQDPLNPSTDQDFIGTMAQFSMLEQVANLAKSNEETRKTLEHDHAIGLIGKTVTYTDESGNPVTGVVEKVSRDGDTTTLTVGGKGGIDPDKVTEVK